MYSMSTSMSYLYHILCNTLIFSMVYFRGRETLYAFGGDYDGFLSGRETGGRTVPAGTLRHHQCTSGWKKSGPRRNSFDSGGPGTD